MTEPKLRTLFIFWVRIGLRVICGCDFEFICAQYYKSLLKLKSDNDHPPLIVTNIWININCEEAGDVIRADPLPGSRINSVVALYTY